jgi:Transposase DDE domain
MRLNSVRCRARYPAPTRRISYVGPQTGQALVLLTNQFALDALTIALIYRRRWQIVLFFRWIKQHLRLCVFLSTSPSRCTRPDLDRPVRFHLSSDRQAKTPPPIRCGIFCKLSAFPRLSTCLFKGFLPISIHAKSQLDITNKFDMNES